LKKKIIGLVRICSLHREPAIQTNNIGSRNSTLGVDRSTSRIRWISIWMALGRVGLL